MSMTPGSFTGNHTYDMLVGAYLVARIVISAAMSIMCAAQVYYEYQYLFGKKTKGFSIKRLNPRILVLIGLTLYPVFRILYSAILFKTHDFDYGSVVVYLGMWTTFFIFQSWIFICCFWFQLLYTFFISKQIKLKNKKRIWIFSWLLWLLVLAYTIGYSIISKTDKDGTPTFYTAGFLVLLVFFGLFAFVNYLILYRQIKQYETKMRSDTMSLRVKKLKILAAALIVTIICVLIRDLIYFVVLKVSMFDNLRHLSSFITCFFEVLQGVIIMIAVSERPSYYFLFRNVNPHRGDVTASSHLSSDSNSPSVASSKNPFPNTINVNDGASMISVRIENDSHVISLHASNLVEWSDDEDDKDNHNNNNNNNNNNNTNNNNTNKDGENFDTIELTAVVSSTPTTEQPTDV